MGKHKNKAGKLPKRIAGVKLPKDLRRTGEKLIAEVDTPANRALLASGLTAVAAAVAQSASAARSGTSHGASGEPAATQPGEGGTRASDPVGKVVGLAATALLTGWLAKRSRDEGGSKPDGTSA